MLNVDRLTIEIDGKCVVEESAFSVRPGKITSIIGESGSGKSMTIAALLTILPLGAKATGHALFNGRNLLDASKKEMDAIRKTHIFTIFQDAANSFNPSVKMERQLYTFSGGRRGDTVQQFRTKMTGLLDELELSVDILKQYPFELSGGMLQRCMIACALYVAPDLLIADEPTSSLDRVLQKEFIELLKRLNEEQGTTILLITHDLDVVVEVAHEMVVMQAGKVVETGSVATIFKQPGHPYTKRLLDSRF
ncbi:ABC transporter ATP-binding protein [Sporosarcina limicola]|uniref:ABC-type dipeptide/oligopeptide/nickel transport system ATPase component n=1 Tax=Sporosarcina limicola TaxID=34101 RepID=A0A927MEU0_9BACL|nr:ABC transporter ATP-binding protein [Sporosarcina limicola]MBE1553265.1 ABC-type dipeptide/oligopeptide/nickel transport system ATPase component [Sporosarcina limicola]